MNASEHLAQSTYNPSLQYVLFESEDPEGCLLDGVLYAWPTGSFEPDFSIELGRFNGDVLVIAGRRAGRRTGLLIEMFDGRRLALAERDLHAD
ncbi:hypothetical protein ACSVIJ_05470 [Pseudomonas sp. NCHU5208]|uniref:hypothetical protein n=1 Tax=unclassified Pseudomonas TaxID=196821 RepID=UPI003F9D4334